MRLSGDDIHMMDCKFTVRGSSPYGYGNIYGIGGGAVVELRKHSGIPIPKDHMLNLVEDGIRAYSGTGHMTVEHCKVNNARGAIKLYMAKSATISDCEVTNCVVQGFSIPSRGTITRSKGNAAYGPLLYVHGDSHSSQKIDLEVLPAPHALGDHPLAAINGRNHEIRFTSSDSSSTGRPIIIGYPLRFDFLCADYPKVPSGYEAHFK
jgi:hypothetical protein